MKYESTDYFRFINKLREAAMQTPYGAYIPRDALVEMMGVLAQHYAVKTPLPWDAQPGCYACGRSVNGPCTNAEGCEHSPAPPLDVVHLYAAACRGYQVNWPVPEHILRVFANLVLIKGRGEQ